jgi:hypothetical protein
MEDISIDCCNTSEEGSDILTSSTDFSRLGNDSDHEQGEIDEPDDCRLIFSYRPLYDSCSLRYMLKIMLAIDMTFYLGRKHGFYADITDLQVKFLCVVTSSFDAS